MTAEILKSGSQRSLLDKGTRPTHAKGLLFTYHGPHVGTLGFVRITPVTYLFIDQMLGAGQKMPCADGIARTLCTADRIGCGFVFRASYWE